MCDNHCVHCSNYSSYGGSADTAVVLGWGITLTSLSCPQSQSQKWSLGEGGLAREQALVFFESLGSEDGSAFPRRN